MTTETRRWLLLCAQKTHRDAVEILDKYFEKLPAKQRVNLVLAKTHMEWVIEQLLSEDHEALA